jgi:hypothetical protein
VRLHAACPLVTHLTAAINLLHALASG